MQIQRSTPSSHRGGDPRTPLDGTADPENPTRTRGVSKHQQIVVTVQFHSRNKLIPKIRYCSPSLVEKKTRRDVFQSSNHTEHQVLVESAGHHISVCVENNDFLTLTSHPACILYIVCVYLIKGPLLRHVSIDDLVPSSLTPRVSGRCSCVTRVPSHGRTRTQHARVALTEAYVDICMQTQLIQSIYRM